MAGPGCTFSPDCDSIGEQSLSVFRQLVQDDAHLFSQRGGENSPKFTAWEMF